MRSFIVAIALLTAACGGGGTELTGIYAIDAWNENPTGCADPGPSVLGMRTETHFYIANGSFFGQDVVVVDGCESPAACRTLHAEGTPLFTQFGVYADGSDDGGWTSQFGSVSGLDPATCSGTVIDLRMAQDETGVVLSQETTDATFPSRGNPDDELDVRCPFDVLYEVAESEPCVSLEVVHGTLAEEL